MRVPVKIGLFLLLLAGAAGVGAAIGAAVPDQSNDDPPAGHSDDLDPNDGLDHDMVGR